MDSLQPVFKETISYVTDICYLEDHSLIVLVILFHGRICAVRISDGEIVWNKSKEVIDKKEWRPNGLAFLHSQDLLLAGDMYKKRILILSPNMGNILQTIPLQEETKDINDLYLVNDKLLVHDHNKLSFYSVSISVI